MKRPTGTLLTLVLVVAAGQGAFAADLIAVYREATLQDAAYAAAKAQYIAAPERLPQVKALQQAVASTQVQLESTKLGQQVAVRTAVDVLNAEQQLGIARRDLAQALYNTILNQLRLKAAVGKLAEANLADINALLKDDTR
jgi:outer membrane protein